MSFIKNYIEHQTLNRRNLLLLSAWGLCGAAASSSLIGRQAAAATSPDPKICWSYRDRTNPFWNSIVAGGEAFVRSLGRQSGDLINLINGGSSEKSLSDIQSLLSRYGSGVALAVDPNDMPNCRPVVEAVSHAGAYVSTIWNKTDDLHPWDFGDNYVSHMTWSDVGPSEQTARVLFDAMGGKGGVVHLGGIASNNPAIERQQGFKNALKAYPNIQLLAIQAADWDTQKANQVMSGFLTRYGDAIKGVHCASDTMAYGVIEALRAEGIENMPVVSYDGNPQAIEMIAKGKLLATVFTNAYWAGGITASLAYYAATGAFKPSAEPREHREFYGPTAVITTKDAQEFKTKYIDTNPEYNWKDFWSLAKGPIRYKS
ncbi:sugar ABC transporter substrate-binding protein [Acetobacter oeni]|uniref:ABC transporter substrate-binding protein n=1 Tax=Acetobacter oeni TaxID=304077 RepID=A0A511XM73_9PROT|nr:sugar ABC transporter substrate-binding protein [Acetobacter oeni]MBB3884058.1 ribose transport system substrate-binding protein [Acetobacter oeni]NHO19998.1 substrate-binding domain-containing protein [Acetobacter oeni]GBR08511.1 sugar ABC transporter substrate-binding periplasmic protein [Acetobacter oeni LMG 21952]GEN64044.1 ABC transporter substrate-binding protein [Acetobacter oeni]